MSDRETPPNTSQSGASEKARHSGLIPEELGGERPGDREFDNTPLHEAVDRGLIGETPESVEPLVQPQETPRAPREESKPSVFEKLRKSKTAKIAAVGSAAVTAVTVAWGLKFMNDVSNAMENPSVPGVSGEQNPGGSDNEPNPDTAPVASGEIPAGLENPIILTDSEVTAVESGNGSEVMDQKLVPALQIAVDAIRDNGFSADGLNLSNVLADKNTISQVEEILSNFADQGSDQAIDICFTTPNIDGSIGFCDPDQASILELGKNAEIAGRTRSNSGPSTFSIGTAMQPTTYGNQLILATDRIEDNMN